VLNGTGPLRVDGVPNRTHVRELIQKATRSERWKLLVDGGQYLLFDLRDDPGERHDLAAQHPDLVVLLKGKIADWEKAVDRRSPSQ